MCVCLCVYTCIHTYTMHIYIYTEKSRGRQQLSKILTSVFNDSIALLCTMYYSLHKITQNGLQSSICNLEVLGNKHSIVSGVLAHLGAFLISSTG